MRTHNQKLSTGEVSQILQRFKDGETQTALAKEFGVNQSRVSQLVKRHRDQHDTPTDSVPIAETQEALDARYRALPKKILIEKYRDFQSQLSGISDESTNRNIRIDGCQKEIQMTQDRILHETSLAVKETEKEKIEVLERQVQALKDKSDLTERHIDILRHLQGIAKALYHLHGVRLYK